MSKIVGIGENTLCSGIASTTLATRPPPFHPPEEVVELVDEPLVPE